jgi:hypothetical protein
LDEGGRTAARGGVYEVTVLEGAFGWPTAVYVDAASVEAIASAVERGQPMVRVSLRDPETGLAAGDDVLRADRVREIAEFGERRRNVFVNPRSTAPAAWRERCPEQLDLR